MTAAGAVAAAFVVVGASFAALVSTAPPAAADTVVTLVGHGFGHGRGMGQWGAQGYAVSGVGASDILDHFYGNTAMGTIDDNDLLDIRLVAQDGRDLMVTSGAPFVVPGIPTPVDAGRTVRIHWTGTQSQLFVAQSPCGSDEVSGYNPTYTGGWITSTVADPGNDISKMLTICNENGGGGDVSYRGALRFLFDIDTVHTVNHLAYWQYLRGTVPRESPSGWSAAALQAQAVAARSYAGASTRYSYANLCDTTACQVYGGAGLSGTYIEATSTNNAIDATAGEVRLRSGVVQSTEYSASTGGYTAGGTFPAVPDDGDATKGNPNHNWTTNLSTTAIADRYQIGAFRGFVFSARNGLGDMGGRVTTLQIVGSSKTVTRSGPGFASDWGLRSDWFGTPNVSGLLLWYLRNSDVGGAPDIAPFAYGAVGDTPLVGDWNNGPVDGIGVFRDGNWYLRNSASPGSPDIALAYGTTGYLPVVGRFNPGQTGIGVFVNGNWFLRPSVTAGPPTASFAYGSPGDVPVVGDWNNDGIDTIGVYHEGMWYLRNTNSPGPPDLVINYGAKGYTPLVGVWQGNNSAETIGVYLSGNWYLRNTNTPGPANIVASYGTAGYLPVRGNWNGGAIQGIGVVVPS